MRFIRPFFALFLTSLLCCMNAQAEPSEGFDGSDEALDDSASYALRIVNETGTPADNLAESIHLGGGGSVADVESKPLDEVCRLAPWLPFCDGCQSGPTNEPGSGDPIREGIVIPWFIPCTSTTGSARRDEGCLTRSTGRHF